MTREEALDKAAKLLRLGVSNNEHEAAAAVAAAHRLLARFEIETAELAAHDVDDPMEERPIDAARGRRMVHWKLRLASALCSHHGCTLYWSGGRFTLCGRGHDVGRVELLYRACAAEIQRLSVRHCRGRGRRFANAFKMGAVHAIATALQQEHAALEAELRPRVSETALTVVDDRRRSALAWMSERHTLRRPSYGGSVASSAGYAVGREAGDGVYGRARTRRLGGSARALPERTAD